MKDLETLKKQLREARKRNSKLCFYKKYILPHQLNNKL